jgi:hypothetical protein
MHCQGFRPLLAGRCLFNLLNPVGYGVYQQVEYFNSYTLCPYYIYVFYICIRTNSDLCHLHKTLRNGVVSGVKWALLSIWYPGWRVDANWICVDWLSVIILRMLVKPEQTDMSARCRFFSVGMVFVTRLTNKTWQPVPVILCEAWECNKRS